MSELKKDSINIKVNKDRFVGTTLGDRYEVIELVGSGAMGSLYRGKHLALDRPVAIKILHSHLAADDVHMERFRREAKLSASLQHPNVVHVYDVGNAADGSPYLVMDFLDGRSLAAIVADLGPMVVRRAVPLMIQIGQGLAYAHSKGLLHRDLKLSNIMVISDGVSETANLIDFGIAKEMNADEASKLTATGEVFGSPLYMSPEQCQGLTLDPRSDLYSFGCVMYEMLTGEPPFRGENLVSTIYKHMNEAPRPLSQANPVVSVPPELEAIVFKALEKDPNNRFKDANEMVAALQKTMPLVAAPMAPIETSPITHHAMTPAPETGAKVKNQFLTIFVVLLVVSGLALAYFLTQKPPIPPNAPATANVAPDAVVAEYTINGQKRQFRKDDYLGDDTPIDWTNPSATNQPKEVIVVYTHQASKHPRSFDINYEIVGDVDVHLSSKHASKPVDLVLAGFAPINWNLKVDPSVKLEKVITSGYMQQGLKGAPQNVSFVDSSDSIPPNGEKRPNPPFKYIGDLSNLGRGENPTGNTTYREASDTIKKLTDGNDITEMHVTTQTHAVEL